MNDFSGIYYRIYGSCIPLILLGLFLLVIDKPWKKRFKCISFWLGLFLVVAEIATVFVLIGRTTKLDIGCHEGEFVRENRTDRVAPPLPFTSEYVLQNGNDRNKVFYLDSFASKKIMPDKMEKGKIYRFYYDKLTKIIVRVEEVENE